MTIERGEAWGAPQSLHAGAPVAPTDSALAELAAAAHRRGEHLIAGVGPGDVARTLGVATGRPRSEQLGFSFDLGFVELDDGRSIPFVAHALARRRWWQGTFAAVLNCGWVGRWYLGPRAHPNDGRLDVIVGSLPLRQRLQARSRVRTGTHLPHPRLAASRRTEWQHDLGSPVPVLVDGCRRGNTRRLRVTVEADCFTLIA
jgi:hypothetical protein